MDPGRLRRGGLLRRDRRARAPWSPALRDRLPALAPGVADRRAAASDALVALGGDGAEPAEIERRRAPRSAPTTWPRSSTPAAPPAGPRAACSPTATCYADIANAIPVLPNLFHAGASHPAVPAAGARVRPADPDRRGAGPGHHGAHRRHQEPGRRPAGSSGRRSCSRVPRVFEKVYNARRAARRTRTARARSSTGPSRSPSPTARRWTRPGGPGLALRAQHALFDRLVYGKLRAALGGRCHGAISGGAPLGDAARPLLPRRRGDHLRGVRADRDLPRGRGQPRQAPPGSAPSAGRCPA